MAGQYENAFCPNERCPNYGERGKGNLAIRGKYGKAHDRDLLYCRTCGKRFAATHATALFGLHLPGETIRAIIHHAAEGVSVRATARLLDLDKDTVNRVILRVGEHLAFVLSDLMRSLDLTEVQLDELWTFVKKKRLLEKKQHVRTSSTPSRRKAPQWDAPGSGPVSIHQRDS